MQFDIKFLHICSVNIILLLFIFAAIGHILQDGPKGKFLSQTLYKYFHITLGVAIISGIWLISENGFWRLSLPNYKYKIFISIILVIITVIFALNGNQRHRHRSAITIILFIIVYSISMYLGSYNNV